MLGNIVVKLMILLSLLAYSSVALPSGRPNVVLVMTDDQGYGDLSCNGNPVIETPHLDALYNESQRLTDFHVAPMCTPTRGQLMTGVDALRNGAMNVSSGRTLLRNSFPTMASVFAANGYHTGIFGKWHLGDNYPYRPQDRGFQESIWFPSSHIGSVPDFWDNDYFDDTYWHNGERTKFSGYCTDVFFASAIDWMRVSAAREQPFFAYVPLNAPHGPLFVPESYRPAVAAALQSALAELPELSKVEQENLVSFLAMIANIDENMGRLEAFLSESGLRQNTIVIFLTDNGSTMGQRYYNAGMRGGKTTLWEGGHRVPCFVRWLQGNFRPPGDIKQLSQVQDLLPTLIELCELAPPADARFDGTSMAGLLRGTMANLPDRMLVVHYSRMPIGVNRPTTDSPSVPKREGAAVLWNRWRLLEGNALYDLNSDPEQSTNIISQHPDVAAAMLRHLDEWWEDVQPEVNRPSPVIIGHNAENPSCLTACEWFDVFVDQQRQVRVADRKNGVWYVEVEADGDYAFELRRWPREIDRSLTAGMPRTPLTDGAYVAGEALPIAQARIQVCGRQETINLSAEQTAARFQIPLTAGPTTLETAFLDDQGQEICGAYYVYVSRQ